MQRARVTIESIRDRRVCHIKSLKLQITFLLRPLIISSLPWSPSAETLQGSGSSAGRDTRRHKRTQILGVFTPGLGGAKLTNIKSAKLLLAGRTSGAFDF